VDGARRVISGIKAISSHSEEVITDGHDMVGLGRVGQRAILIKTNPLRSEVIEVELVWFCGTNIHICHYLGIHSTALSESRK
jgi:hypothetical protein